MDSFTVELVSKASEEIFPNNTLSSFTNFLPEEVNLEGQWELVILEKNLPIIVPKSDGGKIQVFGRKFFKIYVSLHSKTWSIHVHHRHCGSHEYAHSREKQPQRNLHNSQGFWQNSKTCSCACKQYLWSCFL